MPTFSPFVEWCWNLPLSGAIRGTSWAYPTIEIFHLAGMILLLGTVLIVDLRLLGRILKGNPDFELFTGLSRWAGLGFAVLVVSGPLLFIADAEKLSTSIFFRSKLVLLALAIALQFTIVRKAASGGARRHRAKFAAGASLALWGAAIVSGFAIRLF